MPTKRKEEFINVWHDDTLEVVYVLNSITFYQIFGLSVLMYLGILGMLFLIATVFVVVANKKGWAKIPVAWHMRLAGITFVIALIHGLLAILAQL